VGKVEKDFAIAVETTKTKFRLLLLEISVYCKEVETARQWEIKTILAGRLEDEAAEALVFVRDLGKTDDG